MIQIICREQDYDSKSVVTFDIEAPDLERWLTEENNLLRSIVGIRFIERDDKDV